MVIILAIATIVVTAFLIISGRKNKKNTDIVGANWDPMAYTKAVVKEFEVLCKEMPDEFQDILTTITPDIKPSGKVFSRETDGVRQTEMLILEGKYKQKLADENRTKRETAFYAIAMALVRHYQKDTAIAPSEEYSRKVKTLYYRCIDELESTGFYTAEEAAELKATYLQPEQMASD